MSGEKRLAGGLRPQRLRERADVMRTGPAADAEIADAHRRRRAAERGDLVAVAWNGSSATGNERRRNAMRAFGILLGQRLEGRLGRRRPVRDGQRRDMDLHRARIRPPHRASWSADAADAVEPDHVGAGSLRSSSAPSAALTLSRSSPWRCSAKVTTDGSLVCRITSSAISASPSHRDGLGHDEIDPGIDRPADLLLEHRAHLRAASLLPGS